MQDVTSVADWRAAEGAKFARFVAVGVRARTVSNCEKNSHGFIFGSSICADGMTSGLNFHLNDPISIQRVTLASEAAQNYANCLPTISDDIVRIDAIASALGKLVASNRGRLPMGERSGAEKGSVGSGWARGWRRRTRTTYWGRCDERA